MRRKNPIKAQIEYHRKLAKAREKINPGAITQISNATIKSAGI